MSNDWTVTAQIGLGVTPDTPQALTVQLCNTDDSVIAQQTSAGVTTDPASVSFSVSAADMASLQTTPGLRMKWWFAASATVLNPTTVSFAASADDATLIGYELHVYPQAGGAMVASQWLGSPLAVAGVITVDCTAFFATLPTNTVYISKVAAVTAEGSTEGAAGTPFEMTS